MSDCWLLRSFFLFFLPPVARSRRKHSHSTVSPKDRECSSATTTTTYYDDRCRWWTKAESGRHAKKEERAFYSFLPPSSKNVVVDFGKRSSASSFRNGFDDNAVTDERARIFCLCVHRPSREKGHERTRKNANRGTDEDA